jgi:hypothetical protein
VEPDSCFVIAIPGGLKFSPNLPMQPIRREALLDPRICAAPTQPDLAPDSSSGDEGVLLAALAGRCAVSNGDIG